MSKEYISYEEAYNSLLYEMCGTGYQSSALMALNRCEVFDDIEPLVHAHWIKHGNAYKCSNCGHITIEFLPGFHPPYTHCYCGAIMDDKEE